MGLMTGAGCLSRVMGPVCVGIVYTRFGPIWTFGITLLLMLLPMFWLFFLKNRLLVIECDPKPTEMIEIKTESNGEPKMIKTNGIHIEDSKDTETGQFIVKS